MTLFGRVEGPTWRWLNLEARELCPFLAEYLPSLPSEEFQMKFTGTSGPVGLAEGFDTYEIFKRLASDHGRPLEPTDSVLDFGCGWGRIIRYFIRDVEPANIWGIDVSEEGIKTCLDTNHWCRFEVSSPAPPSRFDAASFDLVYAYSVFSHLSEELHLSWLQEFERILKPGGIFLATTLRRQFMERTSEYAGDDPESLPPWLRQAAKAFSDPKEALAAYDRGEYLFGPIEGAAEHFGFACIPEQYVRRRWSEHFLVCDYVSDPRLPQEIIVCRHR